MHTNIYIHTDMYIYIYIYIYILLNFSRNRALGGDTNAYHTRTYEARDSNLLVNLPLESSEIIRISNDMF